MGRVVPVSAFSSPARYDLRELARGAHVREGIYDFGSTQRYNLDGFVCHNGAPFAETPQMQKAFNYAQVFRNGSMEAVDGFGLTDVFRRNDTQPVTPTIDGRAYDQRMINPVEGFINQLKTLGVEPPVILMVSMVGMKGWTLNPNPRMGSVSASVLASPIHQDALLFPEVLIEDFETPDHTVMKPILDGLWNAAGHAMSLSYNPDGSWKTNSQRY